MDNSQEIVLPRLPGETWHFPSFCWSAGFDWWLHIVFDLDPVVDVHWSLTLDCCWLAVLIGWLNDPWIGSCSWFLSQNCWWTWLWIYPLVVRRVVRFRRYFLVRGSWNFLIRHMSFFYKYQPSSSRVRVDQTCKTLLVVPGAHVVGWKLGEHKCRYTVEGDPCFAV